MQAAKASLEHMPQFSGVLRVENLCLQGLGGSEKKKRKRFGLFSCCMNPKVELEEQDFGYSLFFKMWLSVSGENADKQKCAHHPIFLISLSIRECTSRKYISRAVLNFI
jgi:hypothetical protein